MIFPVKRFVVAFVFALPCLALVVPPATAKVQSTSQQSQAQNPAKKSKTTHAKSNKHRHKAIAHKSPAKTKKPVQTG